MCNIIFQNQGLMQKEKVGIIDGKKSSQISNAVKKIVTRMAPDYDYGVQIRLDSIFSTELW